ncbi:peptide chain release factor N(5)-glutamine methyltransferase [Salisediminibacterium selenitireducens]|uniref:Release factor glutamine methyltransferase n=1 Tax=Bacillus selenitireducens (strain ATCC 700615 / DSM 15326 / MLS10) TaxID=439292 RepID=D6Y0T6_BACIE|nr:peptide chain release factor N(5)-glutamine methyltransferase [Salisediminibacterium selenitireducens]ADI00654.1 protein-(glutamine-N5) methyltransferase, release factor-specific [[Bacillus] selenitireducens MLS10]
MHRPDASCRTVHEALRWASSFVEANGYEVEIARILMMHHTGWSRSRLFAEMRTPLERSLDEAFSADIQKAAAGIPVQHLTGEEVFYGRRFRVNRDVLIPRPETEELVEAVKERLSTGLSTSWDADSQEELGIVDIGTGSGILAITLALEIPGWLKGNQATRVIATDISRAALEMARINAEAHEAPVTFLAGSYLDPIIESGIRPRLIVSNPPYIPESDQAMMKDNVKNHEPHTALFAEENGLAAYRTMIEDLHRVLHPEGTWLFFEIGWNQGDAVRTMITDRFPESSPEVIRDINGNERIVAVWIHG